MRQKLSVDIFKTVDQNLEILLEQVIKKFKSRAEQISLKRKYRLAVFLFKECVYDLCDFEDKDPQPGKPKIVLDSVINDISAIVLIKLKHEPENSARSQDVLMEDSKLEEAKSDDTESDSSSGSENEDATRETQNNSEAFDSGVVNHRKRAKRGRKPKRMNSEQASAALKLLSQEEKQILREKVQRALDIQCEFIGGLKESA